MSEHGLIVRSLAGRDKGRVLCVVGAEGEYLYLSDGKHRKLAAPKRKKRKHTEVLGALALRQDAGTAIPLSNEQLRRALAAFRDATDQGGK